MSQEWKPKPCPICKDPMINCAAVGVYDDTAIHEFNRSAGCPLADGSHPRSEWEQRTAGDITESRKAELTAEAWAERVKEWQEINPDFIGVTIAEFNAEVCRDLAAKLKAEESKQEEPK